MGRLWVVMAPRAPEPTLSVPPEPQWVQNIKKEVKVDQTATRREAMFAAPSFVQEAVKPHLADQRDALMIDLIFNLTVLIIPSAILQFSLPAFLEPYSFYVGCAHLVLVYVFFVQRFILCLHYSEHKRLFKASSPLVALHAYLPYFLCNFFGIPGGVYRLHHVVMHHLEDNMFPEDLSSTMPYQRDNFLHFLHYWARFCFGIHFELPFYAFKAKRYGMFAQNFVCHSLWVVGIYLLYNINPTATMFTAILPFFLTSLALMWGNWCQHIFVDPDRPTDDYALTYNCINHIENLYTFNDGYHIVHHINSRVHWSDMPQRFLDELPTYAAKGAICFNNLHFMQVGVLVMTGQWSALYNAYIQLSDEP